MSFALYFVVLPTFFIATGNGLSCVQCSSLSDAPCAGSVQNCSYSTDVCATTRIRNTGYSWHSSLYIRSCINPAECDKQGVVTGLYVKTLSSTTCCSIDKCSPPSPSLPVENSTKNGLVCPSYIDATMEACDIKNKTVCTGDQNRCVRYSTSTTMGASKSRLYLGGCSSESLCSNSNSYISAPGVTLDIKRKCNSNASNLYYSLTAILLPIFALLYN
ncbi:phospholipase A2 inhibitor and Ly6/PLAUR domain-containing protein-like [Discoglossus pictus]